MIKSSLLIGSICTQICGENSVKRMGKTGLEISKILTPKQVTRPPIYRPEKYSRWDLSVLSVDRPVDRPTVIFWPVGATGRLSGRPSSLRKHSFLRAVDRSVVTPRSRNTYLVAYSDFSVVFFDLLPVFVLYYEFFIWSFCLGSGFTDSESALVWTGDRS